MDNKDEYLKLVFLFVLLIIFIGIIIYVIAYNEGINAAKPLLIEEINEKFCCVQKIVPFQKC